MASVRTIVCPLSPSRVGCIKLARDGALAWLPRPAILGKGPAAPTPQKS